MSLQTCWAERFWRGPCDEHLPEHTETRLGKLRRARRRIGEARDILRTLDLSDDVTDAAAILDDEILPRLSVDHETQAAWERLSQRGDH